MICQRFLPKTARRGTRFCGTNCRSRAYRMRQTPEEASSPRLSFGIGDSQQLPEATRPRKRAHKLVTIPAVLEHLQQARERVGLPPLLTDPMLAYQASLDALLTEHRAVQRVLTTHVTDAEQVTRRNMALLKDPNMTQVGVGVALTDQGDSVVVILLGRQVADATTSTHKNTRPPVAMMPIPLVAPPDASPYSHRFSATGVENINLDEDNPKFWMGPESIEDPVSPDFRLDDSQPAVAAAIDPSETNDPEE